MAITTHFLFTFPLLTTIFLQYIAANKLNYNSELQLSIYYLIRRSLSHSFFWYLQLNYLLAFHNFMHKYNWSPQQVIQFLLLLILTEYIYKQE